MVRIQEIDAGAAEQANPSRPIFTPETLPAGFYFDIPFRFSLDAPHLRAAAFVVPPRVASGRITHAMVSNVLRALTPRHYVFSRIECLHRFDEHMIVCTLKTLRTRKSFLRRVLDTLAGFDGFDLPEQVVLTIGRNKWLKECKAESGRQADAQSFCACFQEPVRAVREEQNRMRSAPRYAGMKASRRTPLFTTARHGLPPIA